MKKNIANIAIVTTVFSAAILFNTWYFTEGGVNWDGAAALRLAAFISEGKGFFSAHPDIYDPANPVFFSLWPVGYGFLIGAVAFVTGLPVVWAAKVLHILTFIIIQWILFKMYRENGWIFSLVFLTVHFLEIYSSILSEVLFLLFLLVFIFGLKRYYRYPRNFLYFIIIFLGFTGLFLSRYLGLFTIPVLLFFTFFDPQRIKFTIVPRFFLLALTNAAVVIIYGFINFYFTGDVTGGHIIDQPYNLLQSLFLFSSEFIFQFNVLLVSLYQHPLIRFWLSIITIAFQIGIIIFYIKRTKPGKFTAHINILIIICLVTGFFYLLSILILYMIKGYTISFRFFIPFTFIILLAFFEIVRRNSNWRYIILTKYILITYTVISLTINVGLRFYIHNQLRENLTYVDYKEQVLHQAEIIPGGSLVIFGSYHLEYLRTDLNIIHYADADKDSFLNVISTYPGKIFLACNECSYYYPFAKEIAQKYCSEEVEEACYIRVK